LIPILLRLILLLFVLLSGCADKTSKQVPAIQTTPRNSADSNEISDLNNRHSALKSELQLVREFPGAFYLIVDLSTNTLDLKAGANILRSCKISGYNLSSHSFSETRTLRFSNRIDPHSPEPGNTGLRHRARRMPIDFVGRLTEGPRLISKLYFTPSFLIQPQDLTAPENVSYVIIDGKDIKALGSALHPGDSAILVPPLQIQTMSGL